MAPVKRFQVIDYVGVDDRNWLFSVTGLGQPWCSGWLEPDGTWVHEIHHADGRVERFRDVGGIRYEDNP
jgi:hypothetical protein